MNSNDQKALQEAEAANKQLLRGTWTSPDTTPKKETWYIKCHKGQVAGTPEAGRIVYITKSRGSFQYAELIEQKGEGITKEGLAFTTWTAKILN